MVLGGPPVREGTAASPVAGRVYVGEPLRKAVCWRVSASRDVCRVTRASSGPGLQLASVWSC